MNILCEMFPKAEVMTERQAIGALARFVRGIRDGLVSPRSPRVARVARRLAALGVAAGPVILSARAAGVGV